MTTMVMNTTTMTTTATMTCVFLENPICPVLHPADGAGLEAGFGLGTGLVAYGWLVFPCICAYALSCCVSILVCFSAFMSICFCFVAFSMLQLDRCSTIAMAVALQIHLVSQHVDLLCFSSFSLFKASILIFCPLTFSPVILGRLRAR